jgi:hypothetical protein
VPVRRLSALVEDNRGIAYAILVLIVSLFVFYFAYLLTYNFIMVESSDTFSNTAPPDVNETFDRHWNLLPYVVFGGLSIWFVAYAVRKTGRWGGG